MKQLAEALMQCKSFKERQERLSESLDHLSFNYPDIHTMLYREMKKRELDSNNPSKITKWLNNQSSKSYVKLHEALMLVKNKNIMAKEGYMYNLRHMLNQTIANGTNIEIVVKICNLIEKSPNLTIIHENLKHLIYQVNQLNNSRERHMPTETFGNFWPNYFRPPHTDPFQPFNVRPDQQPSTSVWPNILQPTNLNSAPGLPHFRMECFGYNHLEMIAKTKMASTLEDPQSLDNLTILDQEMDGAVAKWLHYLKLHKYQWFFNGLSYLEIEFIDEDNIDDFIAKVNKNSITRGAQKKICLSTKTLRDRSQKLNNLLLALDLEVTPNELCEFMSYMRDILHYPIPNKNCVVGDQLQQDIVLVMEKLLNQLLEKLGKIRSLAAQSLLGMSINKYLECTLLILGNQTFMKQQIDQTSMFAETLRCRVHRIPRNFN
ncbi:unnamed protein product [Macrosiphum euphorbiae]|uniref:Uncharacterized protein n=1 Tax=Macrosiphum euphorbiae TaxID=13131 RepID=A0AAV0WXG2_9HEMI|nr:unnamed protein product [Macrosiphum euphorbiae]